MTKYKSAANGKSRMVQNWRSKRLMYKSSPNYQCDTSLDVKKPPCKRATYSKKTSAENANVGNEVMKMKPKVNCDPNNAEERLSPIWCDDIKDLDSLLDYLHAQDLGMTIAVDGTKFLLFSSRHLSHKYWRHKGKYYLWAAIIGANTFFPHLEECPNSNGLVIAQGKLNVVASFKEPDGQRSFEGSPQVGRAAIDEGVALVFSTPDEDLIANAVDVFLSSDSNIDGGKIRKTCSSSSIIPRESTNSAVVQVHEKEKSFVTSVMQQALNIVEGDEVTSAAADNGELVGQYYVKPTLATTLRAIIEKHGDIARNCLENLPRKVATFVLEEICDVVQRFQAVEPKNLRSHHLNSLETVIALSEYANVDVEWLKKLHEELHQVMNTMKKYEKLRLSQRSKAKELKSEKTDLGKLQGRVQSLERKISTLERDCERVDSDVHRAKRVIKQFQSNSSIMHGFL
ncbi:hypothetical protein CsatA_029100 [Cannabis sativa]